MSKRRRITQPRSVKPARAPAHDRPAFVWHRGGLIALVIVLIYWNSLSAPFTFDDDHSIVLNTQIQRLWPLTEVLSPWRPDQPVAGRPLVTLSLAINYAVGGLEVRGYHAVNIAVHVLCALLLFGIIRRTLRRPRLVGRLTDASATNLALLCALIWGVHPLQTEAVDYISARTESMMGLFFLLTLYASIRANSPVEAGLETRLSMHRGWWLASSVVACAAGMACKETMGVAPIIVLLYDRTFLFGSFIEAFRRRRTFYLGLATTWLGLAALLWWGPRGATAGFSTSVTSWNYLLNQSMMVVRYLRLTFWPQALVLDYGVPLPLTLSRVAPFGALVIALLVITIAAMVRRPAVGFLGAWFFIILAPTSSFIPIATEVGTERRMYLPLAGIVTLVVMAGHHFSGYIYGRLGSAADASRRRLASAGMLISVVLVCAALATGTVRRNAEYRSGLTLWRTDLERWPQSRAHRNLAAELKLAGYRDEVLFHMREAVRDEPEARYGLGLELFDQGKYTEAVEELQRFLRERPRDANVMAARGSLARAYVAQGDPTGAAEQFRQILKATPTDVDAWTSLGMALQMARQTEEAAQAFKHAVELDPRNAMAQRNLAGFLLDQQDFDGALKHAGEAVRLTPRDPAAHALLGLALLAKLKLDEAIGEFQTSLEIQPSDTQTRQYLERALKIKKSS